MIKYKYNGEVYSLKSKYEDITISELHKIKDIPYDFGYAHYIELFKILGLPNELMDNIDSKNLIMLIKDYKNDINQEIIKKDYIEIDGYKYIPRWSKIDEVPAKKMALIEDKMNETSDWYAYAMAVLFIREDLTDTEHDAEAHIKHKETLFNDVTLDSGLYWILEVARMYTENIQILIGG